MHGNWDAFAAVLRRVRRKRFDATLVLGDLVGYGAGPNQVVEAVRNLEGTVYVVRGNHDKVVCELEDGSNFNQPALTAARWTTERLTPANLRYVREMPVGPVEIEDHLHICHGSPLDEDEYLLSTEQAARSFAARPTAVTFFGHTHIPTLFARNGGTTEVRILEPEEGEIELSAEHVYLINPGSVGQPRDRDPRAAYMIFDSERLTVRLYRVSYPLEDAQQRILDAGLPPVLAQRLAIGI